MTFLNPLLLMGLLGVALPIAIHLFSRFRPKPVEWAAMELLRSALATRAKQVKVEDWLLLLLRCLAVVLLALALARPTLTATNVGGFGGSPSVGMVLAIDASFSMGHHPGVSTRFDAARERARDVLGTLDAGSPLTLVVLGGEPRVFVRNTGYEPEQVEKILAGLEPLPAPLAWEASLDALHEYAAELRAPVREVYLITDAQATQWGGDAAGVPAALQRLGEEARVAVLPVAAARSDNLAVTDFRLTAGTPRAGAASRYTATVRNFGPESRRGVRVRLLQDGEPVDQRVLDELPAGGAVDVALTARFVRPGVSRLSAELDADALIVDNTRHAVADVASSVRVLLVEGEPGGGKFDGQVGFLGTALAPRSGAGLDVEPLNWLDLPSVRFPSYDVVVLANVPDIDAATAAALRSFVEAGGGLWVTLGRQVDPRVYNARLAAEDPLLPATLGDADGRADEATEGRPIRFAADHPMTRVLASLPADLLDDARVQRSFTLAPVEGAETLLWLAGEPDDPLLLTHAVGQGRVMLLGTTVNRAWSNLPVHPVFPILAQQAMAHLTRPAWERSVAVGDALRVTVANGGGEVRFIPPPAAGAEPVAVQAATVDGRAVAELPDAAWPGFYGVEQAGHDPIAVAVNVDIAESDVRTAGAGDLKRWLASTAVGVIDHGADVAGAVRESRVGWELWKPLAALALLAFVAEGLLAGRFTSRAREPVTRTSGTGRDRVAERGLPEELAEAA